MEHCDAVASMTQVTLPDQAHPRAGSTSRQPTRTNARAFRFIGLPLEDRPQELHRVGVEPGHLALPGPGHIQCADSFGLEPLLYRCRIGVLVQVDDQERFTLLPRQLDGEIGTSSDRSTGEN